MFCHVDGLNLCYDDDPVITIEPCTSFSRPFLRRMQLCFRITTFVVAVLLLWPELSLDLTRMAANLCQIFSS